MMKKYIKPEATVVVMEMHQTIMAGSLHEEVGGTQLAPTYNHLLDEDEEP